jgi:hypothetical protein
MLTTIPPKVPEASMLTTIPPKVPEASMLTTIPPKPLGETGRIVGGEEWQEKVYNREEWKKLLRTARNRRILHMSRE